MKAIEAGKILIGLTLAGPGFAATPVDYNRGFCVPKGTVLQKENAIVVINGGVTDREGKFMDNHQFFSPRGSASLHRADWGGKMNLEKTGISEGLAFDAFYEDRTHNHNVDRQLVQCLADGLEPLGFKAFGAANLRCGDFFSARSEAEAQAMKAAELNCSGKVEKMAIRILAEYRGSCWAGVDHSSAIELTYRCKH